MTRKTCLVVTLFLVIVFFVVSLKTVHAQGTFTCTMTAQTHSCLINKDNCDSGFKPMDCSIWRGKFKECQQDVHYCVKKDVAEACIPKHDWFSCPSDFSNECAGKFQCCKTQENCDALIVTPLDYYEICKNLEKTDKDQYNLCIDCFNGKIENNEVVKPPGGTWTALGCIPTDNIEEFAGWLVSNLIYVASGIAFLLLIYGAFRIITANGDAKNVQAGSEMITATVSGLLFIIFSAILLRLIGVDILQIPGLGK